MLINLGFLCTLFQLSVRCKHFSAYNELVQQGASLATVARASCPRRQDACATRLIALTNLL